MASGDGGGDEGPGPVRRLLYRLHLVRLSPAHRDWITEDLRRPGARARFCAAAVVGFLVFWLLYVVLFHLPTTTFGPLALFVAGMLWLLTRPRAWANVEEATLRRHGITTVAQIAGAREGAGCWVDGVWWCDAHGARFCHRCAPRAEG